MIQHTNVMQMSEESHLIGSGPLHVTLEYAGSKSEKRTPYDCLDDILDASVDGRHLAGELRQADCVNALKASDLKNMLIGQIEMFV